MKTKKLVAKLRDFFDGSLRDDEKKRHALKEVLDKLKRKQRSLEDRLTHTKNEEDRAALEKKIKLIRSQRKKGLKLLKAKEY